MQLNKIIKEIRHADKDYRLIEKNDRIAVGISGGKDSIVLLHALKQLQRYNDYDFEIIAIHIEIGFPDMNFEPLNEYCHQNDIELHHEPSEIYTILKHYAKEEGKISCRRCSQLKKACVVSAAQKYHCNKIAFAHHSDDAIETCFMNMIHGGKLEVFQPKMFFEQKNITFIRPLIYSKEKEISKTAKQEQLPIIKSTCPNDGYSERQRVKELLQNIYDETPQAQNNFLKMLSNEKQLKLWQKEK